MKEEKNNPARNDNNNGKLNLGWLTANRYYYPAIKEDREFLKRNMTNSEKILWEELRNKKLGFKFRRQHVIDVFIVDFVCLQEKFVVEIDGGIHKKQKDYDNMREDRLKALGFSILRFQNEEVLKDVGFVCRKIKDFIAAQNKLANQTSPNLSKGEEPCPPSGD